MDAADDCHDDASAGRLHPGGLRPRPGKSLQMLRKLIERIVGSAGPNEVELHERRGFRVAVANTRPDIATADVLSRLDEALALIEEHQPWRLAHLRRDLRQIAVVRYPCR